MNICFFTKALMGVEITRMKAQDVKFVVSAKFTKGTYRRLRRRYYSSRSKLVQ